MANWVKTGLAQPDYVHLFIGGYQIKGEMFYEALVRTAEAYHNAYDSLVTSLDGYKYIQTSYNPITSTTPVHKRTIYHTVKSGETLSHIAVKYKVTIKNIMTWNNLKSTLIRTGQKLVIYK